jgi:hypothetical protein
VYDRRHGVRCASWRGTSSRDLQGDDIAYAGKTETMLSPELRSLVRRHSLTKKINSKRNVILDSGLDHCKYWLSSIGRAQRGKVVSPLHCGPDVHVCNISPRHIIINCSFQQMPAPSSFISVSPLFSCLDL